MNKKINAKEIDTMRVENEKSQWKLHGKLRGILIGALSIFLLAAACKENKVPAPQEGAAAGSGNLVVVGADGTRFDSPVLTSQIPDGAWMCDMSGKVHYAARKRGNGNCPVCSMKLVHQGKHGPGHGGNHKDHSGMGHDKHQ